jgi:hypothetical protein
MLPLTHDKIIAKIQHFAEYLQQRTMDKEALAITMKDDKIVFEIRAEIKAYNEVIEEYYRTFDEILHKD